MNIYREHISEAAYIGRETGNSRFSRRNLPRINLRIYNMADRVGVEQLRADSYGRAHEPRISTREKHILPSTNNFEQLESLSESQYLFFELAMFSYQELSSYLLWKLSRMLARLLLIILIYLDYIIRIVIMN